MIRRIRQLLRTAVIRRDGNAHDGAESQPPPSVLARHVKRAGPDGFLILENIPGEPRGQGLQGFRIFVILRPGIARLLTGGRGNRRQQGRQQQPAPHWRGAPPTPVVASGSRALPPATSWLPSCAKSRSTARS